MIEYLRSLEPTWGWVLTVSLQAALLAGLVLLAQVLLRGRLSPAWRHALWLLVLLRLALPQGPSSSMSLWGMLPQDWLRPTHNTPAPAQTLAIAERVDVPATSRVVDIPENTSLLGPEIGYSPVARDSGQPTMNLSRAQQAREALAPQRRLGAQSQSATMPANSAAPLTPVVALSAVPAMAAMPVATPSTDLPSVLEVRLCDESPAAQAGEMSSQTDVATNESTPAKAAVPAKVPLWRLFIAAVWALGAAVLLVKLLVSNLLLWKSIRRTCVPVQDAAATDLLRFACRRMGIRRRVGLVETSAVSVPALAGVLRPTILLPPRLREQLTAQELEFILLHELAHLRRQDVLINCVAGVLAAVHWFNPLVHLAARRLRGERELACDALVLRRTAVGAGKQYGHTIVKLLESATGPGQRVLVGVLEPHGQIRRRITMIATYKPAARWTALVGLVVLAVLAATSFTSAQEKKPPAPAPACGPMGGPMGGGPMGGPMGVGLNKPAPAPATRPAPPHEGLVTVSAEDDEATAATRKLLATKLLGVDFQELPFQKAIQWLTDSTGANITVNWTALEAAGIKKDDKITLHLRDVKFETALRQVLGLAGGLSTPPAYMMQDGIIHISSSEDLGKTVVTCLYDVRDLFTQDRLEEPAYVNEEGLQRLIGNVAGSVSPDYWREPLGHAEVGTINVSNGQLVVTTSFRAQGDVAAYLDKVRQAAVPQWKDDIRRKLQVKMDVNLENVKLEDALKVVREKAGVNLAIDPATKQLNLQAITLSLKDVTARQVIGMLTDMTNTRALLKNGAVYITGGPEPAPAPQPMMMGPMGPMRGMMPGMPAPALPSPAAPAPGGAAPPKK